MVLRCGGGCTWSIGRTRRLERLACSRPTWRTSRVARDSSVWYYRWLELIRQAEQARGGLIDDDIKCAVATRRSPRELRKHLIV